jgi:hypothetical protein
MSTHFQAISTAKHIDALIQFGTFIISIALCIYLHTITPLLILAPLQLLSCIIWTLYFGYTYNPVTRGGKLIRRAFGITLALLAIAFATIYPILIALFAMIVVGPILAMLYFITTIGEMKYYSTARKPYYLL